jgi:carboxylesterase
MRAGDESADASAARQPGGSVPVLPGAELIAHDGDDIGVLLCHGFTGNPSSLAAWAQRLADDGRTVRVPRLPGHGTTWQEMNRTRWEDWYAVLEAELLALLQRCEVVIVGGLSMGGALALRLAEEHPADVAGLALVNPAVTLSDPRLRLLPVLKHLVASVPGIGSDIAQPGAVELAYDRTPLSALHSSMKGYAMVARDLPKITQPLLLMHSPQDHVVPPRSSSMVLSRVSSKDITEVLLQRSYHVATLDHDAELIEQTSSEFITRVAGARERSGPAGDGSTRATT